MSRITRLSPGISSTSNTNSTATDYGFSAPALPKWRSALAGVRAGAGQAKLLCVGDSTTIGEGATTGVLGSWPTRLTTLLDKNFAPAVNGLSIPRRTSLPDTRWTVGTGWSFLDSQYSWGKRATYTASPGVAGSLVFNPGIQCDTFDIYYLTAGSLGATDVTIGGVTSSLVTGVTSDFKKVTYTRTAGMNTITFAPPTVGSVHICGIDAYLSTASQIRVGNVGVASSQTSDWAYTGDVYNSKKGIELHAPDLTICMLGINDARVATPVAASVVMANILAVSTSAKLTGDFIVMSVVPSQDTGIAAAEQGYRTNLRTLATAQGWPMVDIFGRFVDYTTANGLGFMADASHATVKGYADLASGVAGALSRA